MLQSRISIHLLVARDSINLILSRNASGEQLSPAALAPLQALLNDMQVVKDLLDKEEERNLKATWTKPGVERFAALNGTGESS